MLRLARNSQKVRVSTGIDSVSNMSSTRVSGPISQPAQVPDDSQLEESPYEDTYTFDALKALDWNLRLVYDDSQQARKVKYKFCFR